MDCKHAYFKDGIEYVLCDFCTTPRTKKLPEVTQSMCTYQRFCPNKRTCALLPEWVNCSRIKSEQHPAETAVPAVTKSKASRKKKA